MPGKTPIIVLAAREPRPADGTVEHTRHGSMLREAGYEAREAATVEDALHRLDSEPAPGIVLLVPSPIHLEPASTCLRLKADRPDVALLVVAADPGLLAAGLEAGADACLVEPVPPDLLIAQVTALARLAEHRAAEGANRKLASFPTLNPQPVAEVDLAGRVHYVNPAGERLFPGLSRRGAGHPWLAGWAAEAQRVWDDQVGTTEREVRVGDRWYHQHFLAVRDSRRIRVYCVDITARKHAEQVLRESESFYRQTLESIPGMVFTTRPDGYCDYQSQQWVDYTGIPMSEHLGDGWNRLLHPEDRLRAAAAWRAAVNGLAPYDLEYRVRRHDGAYEWFKVIGLPIRDDAGGIVKWFGAAINVESLKRAEAALAEADCRKDEFIAVLSHELRNPLAPIRYALPLLQRERLGKNGGRAVEVISRQVDHLARLVDDLLDVSRITRGKIDLRREQVTLASVLASAVEAASPAIAAAQHTLNVVAPAEDIWLNADPARLSQVVTNVLNNSAKYTPRGGEITLEGRRDGAVALIRVRDTGMGIPEHSLSTLFEMFRQVNHPLQSQGGLGIGLALAKRLVEMHGGDIEARSEGVGRGAEFLVRLPVSQDGKRPVVEPVVLAPAPGRRLKVLIVDDNPDLVEVLAMVVSRLGHDVRTALDGVTGIAAARSYRPDVVLLDLGLPGVSGIEVARELRQQPELSQVRLVALTGRGQPEDRRQTAEAGFDDHLTKPTDPRALVRLLATLASEDHPTRP